MSLLLVFNPLNAELNHICLLLALLGAHHIGRVSGLRFKGLNSVKCSAHEAPLAMRPLLFWIITQRVVVISYGRFGTTYGGTILRFFWGGDF
jgi:hypothetical protein